MLKLIKKLYRKLVLFFFKNQLSIKINLIFFIYNSLLQIFRFFFPLKRPKNFEEASKDLHKNGFININFSQIDLLNKISKDVKYQFSNHINTDHELEKNGLIRLTDSSINVNDLLEIFKNFELDSILKSYFKSNYYVYSSDIYRTKPLEPEEAPFDSTSWHFDNSPLKMLKVFLYLSDVDVKSGPLTLSNKLISIEMKKKGLFFRDELIKYKKLIEDEKTKILGKSGRITIFSPHNIHKASIPEEGVRDVAVFLVYPSFSRIKNESKKRKEQISRNFGYMINPFSKKPLRYGIK